MSSSFPHGECKACPKVADMMKAFSKGGKFTTDTSAPGSDHSAASTATGDEHASSTEQRPQCPPDTAEIGRATWTFLHTTAAYYPDAPTTSQQTLMRCMMGALPEFYPCRYCASHLKEQLEASPPQVASSKELSSWLCKIHNEVG